MRDLAPSPSRADVDGRDSGAGRGGAQAGTQVAGRGANVTGEGQKLSRGPLAQQGASRGEARSYTWLWVTVPLVPLRQPLQWELRAIGRALLLRRQRCRRG